MLCAETLEKNPLSEKEATKEEVTSHTSFVFRKRRDVGGGEKKPSLLHFALSLYQAQTLEIDLALKARLLKSCCEADMMTVTASFSSLPPLKGYIYIKVVHVHT